MNQAKEIRDVSFQTDCESRSEGPTVLREGGFRDNGDLRYIHEQEGEGKSPWPVLDGEGQA